MDLIKELIQAMPNEIKLNPRAPEYIPTDILKHSADTGLSVGAIKCLLDISKKSKEKTYADVLKGVN